MGSPLTTTRATTTTSRTRSISSKKIVKNLPTKNPWGRLPDHFVIKIHS